MDQARKKLCDLSLEDLKSILNDEDHFEKIMMEIEIEDKTLGRHLLLGSEIFLITICPYFLVLSVCHTVKILWIKSVS